MQHSAPSGVRTTAVGTKSEKDVPSWSDLRPITVAASLYRLWARFRARRVLTFLRHHNAGLVRVNLPTGFRVGFLGFP